MSRQEVNQSRSAKPGSVIPDGRSDLRSRRRLRAADKLSNKLEFITISKSRLFVMYDQPEELDRAVKGFLDRFKG